MITKCGHILIVLLCLVLNSCSDLDEANSETILSFSEMNIKIDLIEEYTPVVGIDFDSTISITTHSKVVIGSGVLIDSGEVLLNNSEIFHINYDHYVLTDPSQLKWGEENLITIRLTNNDTAGITVQLPNKFKNVSVVKGDTVTDTIAKIVWDEIGSVLPTSAVVAVQKDTLFQNSNQTIQRDIHFTIPRDSSSIVFLKNEFSEYDKIVKITLMKKSTYGSSTRFNTVEVNSYLKWFTEEEYLL